MTEMSKSHFSQSGMLVRLRPGVKITRYQVLGERSSGTNFTKRLLGRNTGLAPTEALGWKHGFPHALGIPSDLLVIGMVRAADAWALSMHAKPWHCTPALQGLEFSDFIRADWDTIIDRPRYFDGADKLGVLGEPLQQDRHPLTGRRFDNLFALRRAKLAGLLGYLDRQCSFVLLRMEDATEDPEGTVSRISATLGQPVNDGAFMPVRKRLGAKFKPATEDRPRTPKTIPEKDMEFLRSQIHKGQEKALGYSY